MWALPADAWPASPGVLLLAGCLLTPATLQSGRWLAWAHPASRPISSVMAAPLLSQHSYWTAAAGFVLAFRWHQTHTNTWSAAPDPCAEHSHHLA
jgi:hypothetical protein